MTRFRTFLIAVAALLVAALPAVSQNAPSIAPFGNFGYQHRMGTIFFAPGYATYQASIISGNSATGSATIVVAGNGTGLSLSDGTSIPFTVAFNTNTPITINDANAETVTPSAVSVGTCPAGNLGVGGSSICASITATFSNTHGQSAPVVSGDAGIFEAITDAGNQGGGLVYWAVDTGIVTLSTSGLTTTTTTKVPSNFISMGASARVTTTITVTASWAVGISGSTSAFCTANSTLTAGTTCLANMNNASSVGTTQALTAILITGATSNPGAGAVKVRVWGWSAVQASS